VTHGKAFPQVSASQRHPAPKLVINQNDNKCTERCALQIRFTATGKEILSSYQSPETPNIFKKPVPELCDIYIYVKMASQQQDRSHEKSW
jgi:hypothetical protein